LESVNIVSLITCNVTGLSYVGVTKNGRLDDPIYFSPLRYGFGPRFIEAMRRYGPYAFTVQISDTDTPHARNYSSPNVNSSNNTTPFGRADITS
jgi:hypothetical protein